MTFRTRVVAMMLFGSVLFVTKLLAQGNAPAYLAEMPSVDRVMQAMLTGDPDETAARQMAAFTHLKNMIEKLAGPRFPKNQLTPEENKLGQAYYTAYWQIAKSKPQYGSFNAMRGLDIDSPAKASMEEGPLFEVSRQPITNDQFTKRCASGHGTLVTRHDCPPALRGAQRVARSGSGSP